MRRLVPVRPAYQGTDQVGPGSRLIRGWGPLPSQHPLTELGGRDSLHGHSSAYGHIGQGRHTAYSLALSPRSRQHRLTARQTGGALRTHRQASKPTVLWLCQTVSAPSAAVGSTHVRLPIRHWPPPWQHTAPRSMAPERHSPQDLRANLARCRIGPLCPCAARTLHMAASSSLVGCSRRDGSLLFLSALSRAFEVMEGGLQVSDRGR